MEQSIQALAAVVGETGGRFEIEPVRVGPIAPDELLVEIVAVGICHTDLAVRDQRRAVPLPAILGHEGAGIVRATGAAVRSIATGDHVVLSYMSCDCCQECRDGRPASCGHLGKLCFASERPDGSHAVQGRDGRVLSDRFFGQSAFSTWAVASERNAIVVPPDLPLALLAPLGCGVMTGAGAVWNELAVDRGSSLAVFGAGSVGLSAVIAARVSGAAVIVAVDRVAARLALALELGATHAIDTTRVADLPGEIRRLTGDGVQFALDTTGRTDMIDSAFKALRQRGALAIVATGSPTQTLSLPQLDLMTGCKRVIGVIEGGGSARTMIPRILELYRAGRFAFDRLVTFYDFAQINEAVDACEHGVAIKPVLRMPPRPDAALPTSITEVERS